MQTVTYGISMKDPQSVELSSIQKLRIAAAGTFLAISVGTIGFMYLEDMSLLDAVYMTVITLSSVGFKEVTPLHPVGRLFVIFLIVFGVALAAFTISVIGQLVVEGQLQALLGRKKMEGKIKKIKNHHIIAGFGRVGRQVAFEFSERNAPFVVIEKNVEAAQQLGLEGWLFVQGDATDEDTLRAAGITGARTLISTLPDEAQNVYLTLTARDMSKSLQIIARADYEGGEKKLLRAGANHVVTPHILGGIRMAMASLRPNVVDFMHTTSLGEGGLSIEEVVVPPECKFSGKTLVESRIKPDYNVTIIGVKKEGQKMSVAPDPSIVLEESDVLVLIGPAEGLEKFGRDLS